MPERYSLTSAARFNIAHGQLAPVRFANEVSPRELRWGVLAPWRGHGGKRGPMTFTADASALDAVPLLRRARAKRRCLVLADGWFAWGNLRGGGTGSSGNGSGGGGGSSGGSGGKPGRKSQPYWIHAPSPTAFAAIAAVHADDGIDSFAIVTVPAAGIAAQLGPMMPAIVDDRWLASPELAALPLEGWRVDAVSARVDDPAHDDASVVAPLGNPAQGELF